MEEIQTTLNHIPDNDDNVKILKDVIANLTRVVEKQAQQILFVGSRACGHQTASGKQN